MKKTMILIGALLISAAVMAQEPVQTQTQTKQQTKEQVQANAQEQSVDPVMIQQRDRKRDGTCDNVMQRDRKQIHKDARTTMNRTGARPQMRQGTTPQRMNKIQRGGRK